MLKKILPYILPLLYIIFLDIFLQILVDNIYLWLNDFNEKILVIKIFSQLFMLGFAILGYKLFIGGKIKDIGFKRADRLPVKRIILIFLIVFLLILISFYLMLYFVDPITWSNLINDSLPSTSIIIKDLLFTGTLPGLCEETLYRGFLLMLFVKGSWDNNQKISSSKTIILALISAFIFMVAHLSYTFETFKIYYDSYQLLTSFVLGFVQAFVFLKTRNLWGSIIIHNSSNVLFSVSYYILMLF